MRYFFRDNWIRMVVGFAIGLTVYFLYIGIRNMWNVLIGHVDALFYSFAILIGIGLLSLVLNLGAFDIFSYQVGRKRLQNGKKEDLYEYSKRKKEERARFKFSFLSYFFVAIPFIIAFVVVYICLSSTAA